MIQIPIFAIISATLAITVRLSGLMLFAPFFGSVAIPPRIKAGLVLALTVLLYPLVSHEFVTPSLAHWPFLVFTEFLIGAGMGIATNLVFEAVQLSGQILGMQMGYSLINLLDPQTQVDTTVMAVFYQSIVMLLFLRMDVHFWLLRAVGNSYSYLPPGTAHLNGLFTLGVLHVVGNPGRGRSPGLARQSLRANAAHAVGTRGQKHARHTRAHRNSQVLAGSFSAPLYGSNAQRRPAAASRAITNHG
jgi:flagellar biosynthetic protein FliR